MRPQTVRFAGCVFRIVKTTYVQVNVEFLPFKNHYANIVFSPLYLHWTNDILQTLREIYRILIPDGFFIGAMFAATTLHCQRPEPSATR